MDEDTELRGWQLVLARTAQVGVLALLAANIYSIHKFTWTVAPWWTVLILPACVALLALLVLGGLAVAYRDDDSEEGDLSPAQVFVMMPLGAGLGILLLAGCVPFWVNTWSVTDETELNLRASQSSEATVNFDDGTAFGEDIHVGTDHHFEYGGHSFESFDGEGRGPRLSGTVYRGWLGWEFIVLD